MIIACYAWEGQYQGLHGIEDMTLIELPDNSTRKEIEDALYEWGNKASVELIYSFGLEEEYEEEDENGEEVFIEDTYSFENRGWCGYKVRSDTGLTFEELDRELTALGYDLFTAEYCEKEEPIE